MAPRTAVTLGIVIAAFLAWLSLFQVGETDLAIRTGFGRIVHAAYAPGLHAKWPWDVVHRFDRRIMTHTFPGESFLTSENKALLVEFYVKWRVTDPARYYTSTHADEEEAAQRLGDIVKDDIKGAVARHTLQEVVGADSALFTGDLAPRAASTLQEMGVELVDVRIQRVDLPDEVSAAVYQRMEESFRAQAQRLRAEGAAEAERIAAEAGRKRTELLADAQRDAQTLRGEGEKEAGRIYNEAYSKNPEFYAFYRSLQAYRNALGKDGDVLVVTPDGEFFKYLQSPGRH